MRFAFYAALFKTIGVKRPKLGKMNYPSVTAKLLPMGTLLTLPRESPIYLCFFIFIQSSRPPCEAWIS